MPKFWEIKSQDDQVTVKVLKKRGREVGKAKLIFSDGQEQFVSYKPEKNRKYRKKLSKIALLSGGFLSGILLEAATNALKLR